jgi:predicted phage tail protein
MTEIFVHGKLGKEFCRHFRASIRNPKDAISVIDANFEGFEMRIFELSKLGLQYTLVADDQIIASPEDLCGKKSYKEIHIVPTVCGAGVAAIAVGVVSLLASAAAYSAGAFLLSSVLLSVGMAAISFGIQSLLAKPPGFNNASNARSSDVSATSRSFMFTNKENIFQQGNPVPLGYGRLRIGSAVVQQTIKSYPSSTSTFNEFASQATQEGQGQMSIIYNQEL